jgi:hypothetical protein
VYVYVIMPFASDREYAAKRDALNRAARLAQVELHLPLEKSRNRTINPSEVLSDLRLANLVIADLSLERPSCYFELGLAQALEKPCVLIASRGSAVHQAFGRDEVSFYNDLEDYAALIGRVLNSQSLRTDTGTIV